LDGELATAEPLPLATPVKPGVALLVFKIDSTVGGDDAVAEPDGREAVVCSACSELAPVGFDTDERTSGVNRGDERALSARPVAIVL
jgi:hypothetical protein